MSHVDKTDFSKKHRPGLQLDSKMEAAIIQKAKDKKVPCAVAFDIAGDLGVTAKDLGVAIDLMNYQITKCQLGLFGYTPTKKIVTPLEAVDSKLEAEIKHGLANDRLPCSTVWAISAKLGVGKMKISQACEALEIKIKPCQLGAF